MCNVEQLVVCLRWVNEGFEIREESVGLYEVASTGAQIIYTVITNVLLRLNLSISKVRGQCYDGAAVKLFNPVVEQLVNIFSTLLCIEKEYTLGQLFSLFDPISIIVMYMGGFASHSN